jgi:hypothetical protein
MPGIVGSITVKKSYLDTSVGELFRPGRRSGNRLAIAKLIFEAYGSPLTTVASEDEYEFTFSFLPGEAFPKENEKLQFSKAMLKVCKPDNPDLT